MRRRSPEFLVGLLIAVLLGSYVWYSHRVVTELRSEAAASSRMLARVYRAYGDTTEDALVKALSDLSESILDQGVPIVVTDKSGNIAAHRNLPFDLDVASRVAPDDPRVRAYIPILDAQNLPVVDSVSGTIHFGNSRLIRGLQVVPMLQAGLAVVILLAGFYVIRTRGDAARERLWAGMARESAHQLGTPLSSLAGWIELLEERAGDDGSHAAVTHMRADLDRLDRVAHRFERIGREPKLDAVDVGHVVDRIARYFRARVPTLANTILIQSDVAPDLPRVTGDPVLLEWALEVLTKNAIDALAGRGGHIQLTAISRPEGGVTVRVADDGPGVPRELRSRVFEPGFSTKKSGWGIGLSLAKRIVEENHGGSLALKPAERGATFEINLQ